MQRVIWIVCLSFIVAVTADAIFFELIDPLVLRMLGRLLGVSRMAFYGVSLVALWLLVAGLCALVCFLHRKTERGDSFSYPAESSTP